jgi:hypothetical protein
MIYLSGSASSTGASVAIDSAIPFDSITGQAAGSKISLPSNGTISINDTGLYQITFGTIIRGVESNGQWGIWINGVNPVTAPSSYLIMEFAQASSSGQQSLYSLTTNVRLSATPPTTIQIVNTSPSNDTLTVGNVSAAPAATAAFFTIIKLQ